MFSVIVYFGSALVCDGVWCVCFLVCCLCGLFCGVGICLCMFVWNVLCDDVWFVVGVVFVCRLILLCVVPVESCVMLYGGLFLFCVIVVCLCVLFHVFVGVVRELLRGDVWFGFVCVVFACVCSVLLKVCVVCD